MRLIWGDRMVEVVCTLIICATILIALNGFKDYIRACTQTRDTLIELNKMKNKQYDKSINPEKYMTEEELKEYKLQKQLEKDAIKGLNDVLNFDGYEYEGGDK